MVLDYMVSNDFSIQKIIGGVLVVIGLGYNLWIDAKTNKASTEIEKNNQVSSI